MAKKIKKKSKKKTTPKKPTKKIAKKVKSKKVAKKAPKKTQKKVVKKTTKKTSKKLGKKAPKKTSAIKKTSRSPKAAKTVVKKPVAVNIIAPKPSPKIDSAIPNYTLVNQLGQEISLNEAATQSEFLLLYFYPKDDTPGCTREACDFRDRLDTLTEYGVKVYGVSPDATESHLSFINKYSLNFDLLSDSDHALAEEMGVWKLKQFMGNSYMGVERSSFLYKNGKLFKVWQPVKVEGHADEILSSLGHSVDLGSEVPLEQDNF
jgi:peroxiredoxin Q/BCP